MTMSIQATNRWSRLVPSLADRDWQIALMTAGSPAVVLDVVNDITTSGFVCTPLETCLLPTPLACHLQALVDRPSQACVSAATSVRHAVPSDSYSSVVTSPACVSAASSVRHAVRRTHSVVTSAVLARPVPSFAVITPSASTRLLKCRDVEAAASPSLHSFVSDSSDIYNMEVSLHVQKSLAPYKTCIAK